MRPISIASWLCCLSLSLAVTACGDDVSDPADGSITGPDATTQLDVNGDTGGETTVTTDIGAETSIETDTTSPECAIDSDCEGSGPCAAATCNNGVCEVTATPGAACDDGDACTDTDICDANGVCAGEAVVCDDGNDCTVDTCEAGQGCVATVTAGAACDDGSACTQDEVCSSAGTCLGIPKVCEGGEGCLTGACDDETGECGLVPAVGASCDDGDPCTVLDACDALGECGGAPAECDDDVDCTADSCDPDTGACVSVVDEVFCDDGDPCTTPTCDLNAGCINTPDPTCCSADTGCYDGDVCTSDVCDLATNLCVFSDTGTCCQDNSGCPANEVCVDGGCFPEGDPVDFGFPRPATWVSNMDLGGVEGVEECCFDFDGDGTIDNAVGELASALSGLLGQGGINTALDAGIINGSVNLLFSFPSGAPAGLPDITPVPVGAFQGDASNGATLSDKIAGAASFTVPLDNFLPGTSLPVGSFGDGDIAASALTAGPGKLYEVPLQVLYFDFSEASLELATIAGDLAPQGPGFAMANGQLGGVLPMVSVWNAINAFVTNNCDCLGLEGAQLITPKNEAEGICNVAPANQVTCGNSGTDAVCNQLNQFCPAALLIVNPDFDIDGNGVNDGMTLGLWFDGAGTTITGLSP